MSTKPRLLLGALALSMLATTGLTGCAATGTGAQASSGGVITLTAQDYYGPSSPQSAAIDKLYADFAKANPGITIERTVIGENLIPKLQAQATTNSMPDIALIDNPEYPAMVATGKLQSLTEPLKEWGLTDAYSKGVTNVVTDKSGDTRGVFIGTNTTGIFYNKDIFAKAGITSPPTTWPEFLDVGKKLTTKDVQGFMFSARSDGCGSWHYAPWQYSAGGSDTNLADAGNAKALTFISSLVQSGVSSKEVVNQCQDEGMNAFVNGQAAMIQNGPWSFATLEKSGVKWGSFPIPVPTAGDQLVVPMGGEVFILPTSGDEAHQKAALQFLKWSQDPAIVAETTKGLGYIPAMPSLWDGAIAADPRMESFVESSKNARGRTTNLGESYPKYSTALMTAVQQAILGQATPEAALAAAQKSLG